MINRIGRILGLTGLVCVSSSVITLNIEGILHRLNTRGNISGYVLGGMLGLFLLFGALYCIADMLKRDFRLKQEGEK